MGWLRSYAPSIPEVYPLPPLYSSGALEGFCGSYGTCKICIDYNLHQETGFCKSET